MTDRLRWIYLTDHNKKVAGMRCFSDFFDGGRLDLYPSESSENTFDLERVITFADDDGWRLKTIFSGTIFECMAYAQTYLKSILDAESDYEDDHA